MLKEALDEVAMDFGLLALHRRKLRIVLDGFGAFAAVSRACLMLLRSVNAKR